MIKLSKCCKDIAGMRSGNNIKDPKIVNALCNLRPLAKLENLKKKDKIYPEQFNKVAVQLGIAII